MRTYALREFLDHEIEDAEDELERVPPGSKAARVQSRRLQYLQALMAMVHERAQEERVPRAG